MKTPRCLWVLALLALAVAPAARAEAGKSLLELAVENWLGGRDHWAFTQRAVEYDGDTRRERLERYDPSQPGEARWTLLAIDGQPPTAEQRAAWAKKKFRKPRRRFDAPLGDYFNFAGATVISASPSLVHYEVPLRDDRHWLFEADKVRVRVSINRKTQALEHLAAHVREPVKVLLGLARITDGRLDLSFLGDADDVPPGPDSAQPTGSARVTVSKLGERAEFTWSDFKRVTPAAGRPGP